MNANEDNSVPVWIVLLAILSIAGCQYESSGVAAGLTAEALPQVRLGMTREDVLRLLGPPLSERTGSSGFGSLVYARSRSLSMGSHLILQPGLDCGVLLENGLVSEAYVTDANASVRCSCRADACDDAWAFECLRTLR